MFLFSFPYQMFFCSPHPNPFPLSSVVPNLSPLFYSLIKFSVSLSHSLHLFLLLLIPVQFPNSIPLSNISFSYLIPLFLLFLINITFPLKFFISFPCRIPSVPFPKPLYLSSVFPKPLYLSSVVHNLIPPSTFCLFFLILCPTRFPPGPHPNP